MLQIAPDTLLQQRYRILSSLGAGGFGRTYLATDRSRFDEYCAIKELTPSTQSPAVVDKAKEFFQQEATLLYQLQHPQIPRFWATFEEDGRLFLVQDYIAGKTYAHLVDDRREYNSYFNEAEVWRFLLQVLPVLGYIHSKGVIHRDISPENIILRDSDLLPVLIDFGVVKEFADRLQSHPISKSNVSVGKAGYAPVEQLKRGEAYPNSDLYSLAVTAIVLLTGKDPSALFVNGAMNWDWRNWTQISDGMADVLHRMLSPNPSDRYQSGVEVFQALQSLSIVSDRQPQSGDLRATGLHHMDTATVEVPRPSRQPSVVERVKTAITNLQLPSIWEKPQVFIPLGVLISLLAGMSSWFIVSQLVHSRSQNDTQPTKQIDFNDPTIATDTASPIPPAPESIVPVMDKAVTKEGVVTATTPVKYRIAALSGQNFDIEVVTLGDGGGKTAAPVSKPGTISSSPRPLGSNQVLMTILSPAGMPIDAKADRVVSWRGQIPFSGDYTIELRPIKGLTGNAFPYKLAVTQVTATAPIPTPSGSSQIDPTVPGANGMIPLPPNLPSNPQGTFDSTPIQGLPNIPDLTTPIFPESTSGKKKAPGDKPRTQTRDRKSGSRSTKPKPASSPDGSGIDNLPQDGDPNNPNGDGTPNPSGAGDAN